MCGIVGIINFSSSPPDDSLIRAMTSRLKHRGPDDQGFFTQDNVSLGFTRLAVHDLTPAGHQPMLSFNKQWVMVFNGEIYNYAAVKKTLQREHQIIFKSESDTEVLVNAIAIWGIEKTLQACVGMFAFAAYHLKNKTLFLARDRFGEKPLYFGFQNNLFAFSSEIKALKPLQQKHWTFDVDRNALATYMRFGYVPTPYSIFQHIYKLEAGNILVVDQQGNQQKSTYWAPKSLLSQQPYEGTYEEARDELHRQLKDSVKMQMSADVPLGAFLSGGIDSSTIVALMQSQSKNKINTFSIGFHEDAFNEAPYAKQVAQHLGTHHSEIYVSEADALRVIPLLPDIYDEPFADSSQIPTYLVSQLAREKVTVSLSGDAGDELFGGYIRYLFADKIKRNILSHAWIHKGIQAVPPKLLQLMGRLLRSHAHPVDKLLKLQRLLKHTDNSHADLYLQICSQIHDTSFVLNATEYAIFKDKKLLDQPVIDYQSWMMFADAQTYLMDDILTKVDRAAMAVSLETRIPFLDHRLVEFVWSLPHAFKIQHQNGKRLLKDVLYHYVPKELIDRPKMGFGVPLAKWLRQDLKPWATELLAENKLREAGYMDANIIQNYWREHQNNTQNWQAALWNILMFQSWLESW